MAYDPNLDHVSWSEAIDFETTKIMVSVYAYNEGTPKIQISRENKNKDGEYSFAKLGRMTKVEAVAVLPLMQKAIESME